MVILKTKFSLRVSEFNFWVRLKVFSCNIKRKNNFYTECILFIVEHFPIYTGNNIINFMG